MFPYSHLFFIILFCLTQVYDRWKIVAFFVAASYIETWTAIQEKYQSKEYDSMKTAEELNAIKEEYESIKKKLEELNEEELEQVTGGVVASGGIHVWHGAHG